MRGKTQKTSSAAFCTHCNPYILLLATHSRDKTITQTHDLLSSHAELKLALGRCSQLRGNISFGPKRLRLLLCCPAGAVDGRRPAWPWHARVSVTFRY